MIVTQDEQGGLVLQLRSTMKLATELLVGLEANTSSWQPRIPCAWMLLQIIASQHGSCGQSCLPSLSLVMSALRAPVLASMSNGLPMLWELVTSHLDLGQSLRTCLECGGDIDPLVHSDLKGKLTQGPGHLSVKCLVQLRLNYFWLYSIQFHF